MKILKLRFKNINSLYGDWTIDFEDPRFADGIFLITGDTGSGKTSILDAISLALYGRTVREEITQTSNEVMSRGAGVAHAELDFISRGAKYTAIWEQRRAHEKSCGALQNVWMGLLDEAGNAIADNRLGETKAAIVEAVGLSFEQFQRTMMLAQGKFDKFLTAKENERAEILSEASGIDIYEKIGRAIFEHRREAEEKKKNLSCLAAEINILGEAEAEEKRRELELAEASGKEKSSLYKKAVEIYNNFASARDLREKARGESLDCGNGAQAIENALEGKPFVPAGCPSAILEKIKTYLGGKKALGDIESQEEALEKNLSAAAAVHENAERLFGREMPLLKEKEKVAELELRHERDVEKLESMRRRLAKGEPCPLCGSTLHPYIEHGRNIKKSVFEKALEDAREAVAKLASSRESALRDFLASQKELENFKRGVQAKKLKCENDRVELVALKSSLVAKKEAAGKALSEAESAYAFALAQVKDPQEYRLATERLAKEIRELNFRAGALAGELKQDAKNRKRLEALNRDSAAVQDELAHWENLDKWLGGSGGERFKRYAQGITLRRLLGFSNPHLKQMTLGRYELVWNPDDARDAAKLLPELIDNEQGMVRRPVSNLSGGERFQVSLALALGLCAMSSARLRIDSLFLDEGFGTLDSKNLEEALDTLCSIQEDGKLIGVISHVREVAERLSTQISVTKSGSGRSLLSGAGVVG